MLQYSLLIDDIEDWLLRDISSEALAERLMQAFLHEKVSDRYVVALTDLTDRLDDTDEFGLSRNELAQALRMLVGRVHSLYA